MNEARHEKLPTAGTVQRTMTGLLEAIAAQATNALRPLAAE